MPDAPADRRAETVRRLLEDRAVAVVRTDAPEALVAIARALAAGGVACVEVTMTVPDALDGLRRVRDALGDRVLLGAGSVTDAATAAAAVEAGARYIVSPVFRPDVIEAAHAHGAAALPGCFTPTEAFAAAEAGADVVKVFPASVLGPDFLKALLAPLPHLRLMPTGGVTPENAADWLRAGAVAVGVGGALVDAEAIRAGAWDRLTDAARRLREVVDAA